MNYNCLKLVFYLRLNHKILAIFQIGCFYVGYRSMTKSMLTNTFTFVMINNVKICNNVILLNMLISKWKKSIALLILDSWWLSSPQNCQCHNFYTLYFCTSWRVIAKYCHIKLVFSNILAWHCNTEFTLFRQNLESSLFSQQHQLCKKLLLFYSS